MPSASLGVGAKPDPRERTPLSQSKAKKISRACSASSQRSKPSTGSAGCCVVSAWLENPPATDGPAHRPGHERIGAVRSGQQLILRQKVNLWRPFTTDDA